MYNIYVRPYLRRYNIIHGRTDRATKAVARHRRYPFYRTSAIYMKHRLMDAMPLYMRCVYVLGRPYTSYIHMSFYLATKAF